MKKRKNIVRIWTIGIMAGTLLTVVFVYLAFQARGYWAYGSEYGPFVMAIFICIIRTNNAIRYNHILDQKSAERQIDKCKHIEIVQGGSSYYKRE